MNSTRQQILQTAGELIEKQGYNATGLNEIVEVSGAPKGSLYYHFPQGKDEITAEAIAHTGRLVQERIRANLAMVEEPAEAVARFVRLIADNVERSDFCSGSPLQTVALETAATNPRLNQSCREAYDWIQAAFAEKLQAGGLPAEQANELALFITASIEGAIILSRTYHTGDPLRRTAGQLERCLRQHMERP